MLRELVTEMQVALQLIKGEAVMRVPTKEKSVRLLKRKIIGLSHTIYDTSEDMWLKALVNSVFDSMTVEEILIELRNMNDGQRPQIICSIDDE